MHVDCECDTCAARVDRNDTDHWWTCSCPLSVLPVCRVLQGKSHRGPGWTGVSPLQGEGGMFQRVVVIVATAAAEAAHRRRWVRVWVSHPFTSLFSCAPVAPGLQELRLHPRSQVDHSRGHDKPLLQRQ